MTTNQTIDGVPRSLLQSLYTDTVQQWGVGGNAAGQLRALLDADKVNNRQMGLMQFVEAHPIKPAGQPQGVPVHQCQSCKGRGTMPTRHAGEGETEYRARCKLYAEQPAPVAVVLPERLNHSDGLHTYEYVTGHNDAIDKMLGAKSR
ncbi:hypothetical protein [Pseudomonas synxantha]|uniref:hypothetical protein n=1 Tax=Pseudomonas synxantha TaxID=47883 RepID=UPI00345C92C4